MQAKRKPRKHISTLYNLKGNIFPDFFQLTTLFFTIEKLGEINQMMGGRRVYRYILKIFHASVQSSTLPPGLLNWSIIPASQLQARRKPRKPISALKVFDS